MTDNHYYRYPVAPNPYPVAPNPTPMTHPAAGDCGAMVRLATMGAVIGGSIAAANQIRRVQAGEQMLNGAMVETGKGAVAAGIATAVGGALASTVAEQGLLRLGVMFLAGSAVAYGLHNWASSQEEADE